MKPLTMSDFKKASERNHELSWQLMLYPVGSPERERISQEMHKHSRIQEEFISANPEMFPEAEYMMPE